MPVNLYEVLQRKLTPAEIDENMQIVQTAVDLQPAVVAAAVTTTADRTQTGLDRTAAEEAATIAESAAVSAATGSAAPKWVSGTTYAAGVSVWSPANFIGYRRKIAGAGTLDPSVDSINWAPLQLVLPGDLAPFALSQGIVTTYAASGSTGFQIANNDNLNFGTDDFTLVWKGSLPDWTLATSNFLFHKYVTGFGIVCLVEPTGALKVGVGNGSSIFYYTSTALLAVADASIHTVGCSVVRETATTAGSIVFTVDGMLFQTFVIPAAVPTTYTNANMLYVSGYNGSRIAATTQAVYAFNRALSAAEGLSLYRYGVAESDKWGSQTELIINGGFDTDTTWVKGTGVTISGGAAHFAAAPSASNGLYQPISAKLGGYLYKVRLTVSGYVSGGIAVRAGGDGPLSPAVSANGTYILSVTTAATGSVNFVIFTSGSTTLDIDSVSVIQVGATLALEPEGIQPAPGQWLDSSSNKLHALQPATGSSLARKKSDVTIEWINTWAGTNEMQYVGGVNQAVLPPNVVITEIASAATAATTINMGDGANASRWVSAAALAAEVNFPPLAKKVSDGTNRKLTITPAAAFTGSITTTLRGYIRA